jgi:hypothetical protein
MAAPQNFLTSPMVRDHARSLKVLHFSLRSVCTHVFAAQPISGDICTQSAHDPRKTQAPQGIHVQSINGQRAASTRWRALITITTQRPRNERELRANPLGLKIEDVSWSIDAS